MAKTGNRSSIHTKHSHTHEHTNVQVPASSAKPPSPSAVTPRTRPVVRVVAAGGACCPPDSAGPPHPSDLDRPSTSRVVLSLGSAPPSDRDYIALASPYSMANSKHICIKLRRSRDLLFRSCDTTGEISGWKK